MLNDLEIARQVRLKNIDEIAAQLGLSPADIDHYGEYKAKIRYSALSKIQGNDHGKLILVSAITPTPAGEGKTTVAIGLSQAINRSADVVVMLILGGTEVAYLSGCDAPARALAVATMLKSVPAAVMIARGLAAPPELIAACDAVGVPVVASALITSDLIVRVTGWLAERMAPQTSIHGVLLDVLGIGILLLGPSGIGKSETALDLVVRGHRLVADDIVIIRKKAGFVFGSGSGIIRHHMEIRGLGIINIKDLFGVAAIREAKKVELVVELVEWDANEEYDRLGLDDTRYTVLDVQVPMVRLPVRPGRNLSTIIEVAARNQLLKFQGHHSARAARIDE